MHLRCSSALRAIIDNKKHVLVMKKHIVEIIGGLHKIWFLLNVAIGSLKLRAPSGTLERELGFVGGLRSGARPGGPGHEVASVQWGPFCGWD